MLTGHAKSAQASTNTTPIPLFATSLSIQSHPKPDPIHRRRLLGLLHCHHLCSRHTSHHPYSHSVHHLLAGALCRTACTCMRHRTVLPRGADVGRGRHEKREASPHSSACERAAPAIAAPGPDSRGMLQQWENVTCSNPAAALQSREAKRTHATTRAVAGSRKGAASGNLKMGVPGAYEHRELCRGRHLLSDLLLNYDLPPLAKLFCPFPILHM